MIRATPVEPSPNRLGARHFDSRAARYVGTWPPAPTPQRMGAVVWEGTPTVAVVSGVEGHIHKVNADTIRLIGVIAP